MDINQISKINCEIIDFELSELSNFNVVHYLRKEEFIYILIKWKINGNILLFEMNFNDSILEFRDHNWRFFRVFAAL